MSTDGMDGWTRTTVADIASPAARSISIGPFGSNLRAEVYTESGFPVLRGQDITAQNELDTTSLVYVPVTVARSFPGCIVRHGDLIFPHRGAIGRVGIVGHGEYLLSSSMMKLTCDRSKIIPEYLFYYFRGPGKAELLMRSSTVGTPGIAQPLKSLREIPIAFPKIKQQRAIAGVLGALDDKITANIKLAYTVRTLANAEFDRAASNSPIEMALLDSAELVTRGITPSYTIADSGVLVLNQKCIRGQRVTLEPARLTDRTRLRQGKMLKMNDVLVNSTGQGTLGRVARWTTPGEATTDSHISIVRFDASIVGPVCGGFALLRLQPIIEQMGEGSTGQTELSRAELGKLCLVLPNRSSQVALESQLVRMVELEDSLWEQKTTLAATRDALLPYLMSGRLRVKDAEKIVSEAV